MLKTKSIQKGKNNEDGIRICIMRRPGEYSDADFDMWLPALSPSHQLLTDYHAKKVNWDEYLDIFKKEVLKKQTTLIKMICDLSKNNDVTLLCWEKSPEKCHRRLVAEECGRLNKSLEFKIK